MAGESATVPHVRIDTSTYHQTALGRSALVFVVPHVVIAVYTAAAMPVNLNIVTGSDEARSVILILKNDVIRICCATSLCLWRTFKQLLMSVTNNLRPGQGEPLPTICPVTLSWRYGGLRVAFLDPMHPIPREHNNRIMPTLLKSSANVWSIFAMLTPGVDGAHPVTTVGNGHATGLKRLRRGPRRGRRWLQEP